MEDKMKKEQYDRIVGRRRAAALKRTARAVVALVVVAALGATVHYAPQEGALAVAKTLAAVALLPAYLVSMVLFFDAIDDGGDGKVR